jgi:hypothetical protein
MTKQYYGVFINANFCYALPSLGFLRATCKKQSSALFFNCKFYFDLLIELTQPHQKRKILIGLYQHIGRDIQVFV